MNPWLGINRFLLAFREAFAAMGRWRTWTPFLLFLILQLVLMGVLWYGVRPPFSDALRLAPAWLVPADFFTYPMHLLRLPEVLLNRVLVPFGALLHSILLGAATLVFVRFARGEDLPTLGGAVREVRPVYGKLIIFWVLNWILLLGYQVLFDRLVGDLWIGYGRRRMAIEAGYVLVSIILNGLVAYSTVIIVLERVSPLQILIRSVRAFIRLWFATMCIIAVGLAVVYPAQYLIQKSPLWVGRFNPEVMLALLVAYLVLAALATYLWTAVLSFWYVMHRSS